MAVVAALLDSAAALAALRKSLPRGHGPVRACRSVGALGRCLDAELVDAVVVGTRSRRGPGIGELRARYPLVPLVVYGAFRPDEGRVLLDLEADRIEAVLVEGVDDPVAGGVVAEAGYLARRRKALADLPRLLRLTEPVQRRTFDYLVSQVGPPPSTMQVARRMRISREHLSRQFGAGGAPNLKRIIDFLRVLQGRELLQNPGFSLERAARVGGFSTLSHWRAVVRRVSRLGFEEHRRASTADLVRRFATAGARSRD